MRLQNIKLLLGNMRPVLFDRSKQDRVNSQRYLQLKVDSPRWDLSKRTGQNCRRDLLPGLSELGALNSIENVDSIHIGSGKE